MLKFNNSIMPIQEETQILPNKYPSLLSTINIKSKHNKYINATIKFINNKTTIDNFLNNFDMPVESSKFYTNLIGHNIHPRYWILLNAMRGVEFTFIVDNNSNMKNFTKNTNINTTKYQRLLYDFTIMLDLLSSIKSNGVNIYTTNMLNIKKQKLSINDNFNGSRFTNINNHEDLENIFKYKPLGNNNIHTAIESAILDHISDNILDKSLIIYKYDYKKLYKILNNYKEENIKFVFYKTYDMYQDLENFEKSLENNKINIMNTLKNSIVIDTYSEYQEKVFRHHGEEFRYSRCDHELRKICISLFTFLKNLHKYNYPKLEYNYISSTMDEIIKRLITDREYAQTEMIKYAKKNKNIGKYMLDIKIQHNKRCIIS